MKINMYSPILGLDDKAIVDENDKPILLRTIVQGALLASLPEDRNVDGARKATMFKLALEANKASVDWSAEEIAIVKERIGQTSTPLAVGRSYELLDPPAEKELAGDNLHA